MEPSSTTTPTWEAYLLSLCILARLSHLALNATFSPRDIPFNAFAYTRDAGQATPRAVRVPQSFADGTPRLGALAFSVFAKQPE